MSSNKKVNLLGVTLSQMKAFLIELGEKPFRATQILKWIHQFGVSDFDQMSNISKSLREKLKQRAEIRAPEVVVDKPAADNTHKWVMKLDDGQLVETVFIPTKGRGTLCVSSQVGCALECSFCSTGKQGFNRNLSTAEIVAQLWWASKTKGLLRVDGKRAVTNVVMMGMGEPLANYQSCVDAMDLFKDDNAYGLSRRRVTISTSGLVPALYKLADDSDVALAVSLHAPNDKLRDELVPINKKYPLEELIKACNNYLEKANPTSRITMEYTLIKGVNDSSAHARELVQLLKKIPSKVNLIPFNPFPNSDYERPDDETIDRFSLILHKAGLTVTVRRTRGDDIDAACGQLVGKVHDRTKRNANRIIATDAGGAI